MDPLTGAAFSALVAMVKRVWEERGTPVQVELTSGQILRGSWRNPTGIGRDMQVGNMRVALVDPVDLPSSIELQVKMEDARSVDPYATKIPRDQIDSLYRIVEID